MPKISGFSLDFRSTLESPVVWQQANLVKSN